MVTELGRAISVGAGFVREERRRHLLGVAWFLIVS